MRVLLSGATGFIGSALARRLVTLGHEVVALSRDANRAATKLPARCVCREWDPATGQLDVNALTGCDAVIHLAGEGVADKPWTTARQAEILSSRADTTRAIVAAVRALPPASRPKVLVGASAVGFYGDRGDEILTEESPAGAGFLADVCKAWEHETRAAEDLGLRTVLMRIGVVLGKDGGALAKMLPPFQLGAGGRLGDGRQWMSWIHIDDLVELLVASLENPGLRGVVNGVAPNPVTNTEFTKALGRALHRPTLIPVPRFALQLALGDRSSLLFASQRVLPKAAESAGFEFQYGTIEWALDDLVDGVHEIHAEQWVNRPLAEVFPFFSDARNLEQLTPAFLNFQVLKTSTPTIREGTLIDYKLSLHGLPMHWQSRIESWEPGRSFVDTQVSGPYQLWHHAHEFEEYRGGTIIRDRVRYRMPLGGIGDTLARPFVQSDLKAIFDFRRQRVRELFVATGSGPAVEAAKVSPSERMNG